jgi:tRNA (cytidine/uridine-2'-O-)-methyltransferase
MFNIALFEPEIPPNTGNIMRLCANSGCHLHLIEPLGFSLEEKQLRRAALDYRDLATITVHQNIHQAIESSQASRVIAVTTKGELSYQALRYQPSDLLILGPETRGLPVDLLHSDLIDHRVRIPMIDGSRSMNLSNAAAVIIYEAWRQHDFLNGY